MANLYRGSAADAGAVDVYGSVAIGVDDTPLVIIPYGTMSDWFDPGILDDQRDSRITVVPHGARGSDDEITSQSETLKGDEQIWMFVADAGAKNPSGKSYGRLRVVFAASALNPMPTAPPGQSVVILDLLTLPNVQGPSGYVYLSTGGDCLTDLRAGNDGPQPLSGGNSAAFAIPAGPQVLTLHRDTTDCKGLGLYDGIPVQLAAGQRAFVVPFSLNGTSIRALVVPIEP